MAAFPGRKGGTSGTPETPVTHPLHQQLEKLIEDGLTPDEVHGIVALVTSMRRNRNVMVKTEAIEGADSYGIFESEEGWTMHDLTNTEDLLKEHSLGEMDLPKKKFVKKAKKAGVPRAAQTKPVEVGIEKETQTETPEERSDSPGESGPIFPPHMWRDMLTPDLINKGPLSRTLSEISSASMTSIRIESPILPPCISGSPEADVEAWLMTPGGFHREDEDQEMEEAKKTPAKVPPVEEPKAMLKVTIKQEHVAKVQDQTEVTKTLQGYQVPKMEKKMPGRKIVESRSPSRTRSEQTPKDTAATLCPSLVERVYRRQVQFRIPTLDSRATTAEDQRRGWKAHTPSPYNTEPRSAADRHISSSCVVDSTNAPPWVVTLFHRMKGQNKEEHLYLPVTRENEDYNEMPGRTDSWTKYPKGYQSFAKLSLDRMKKARVIIVTDSTLRPVPEHNYLMEDVVKIVMPRSTLRQMHNVVHFIVNHVATPPLVVLSNVVDDLAEKNSYEMFYKEDQRL